MEYEIDQVMRQFGMDRLQALRHLQSRELARQHAERQRALASQAAARWLRENSPQPA